MRQAITFTALGLAVALGGIVIDSAQAVDCACGKKDCWFKKSSSDRGGFLGSRSAPRAGVRDRGDGDGSRSANGSQKLEDRVAELEATVIELQNNNRRLLRLFDALLDRIETLEQDQANGK